MNSGLRSSGGRGVDVGIQRREDREHGEQGRDEDAHRALVGRQLDVEIGEPEQPDERRDGRGRADERRIAGLHRLHPDEKRVREDAGGEQRRGGPPDARVAAGEVRAVGGRGRGVEDERQPGAWRHYEPVGP